MRIGGTFGIANAPESVFDSITDPRNLREWQTAKTRVEPAGEGLSSQATGFANGPSPGVKEFEQVL